MDASEAYRHAVSDPSTSLEQLRRLRLAAIAQIDLERAYAETWDLPVPTSEGIEGQSCPHDL